MQLLCFTAEHLTLNSQDGWLYIFLRRELKQTNLYLLHLQPCLLYLQPQVHHVIT